METKTPKLTIERLREVLEYNPETGIFKWLLNRRGHVKAGDIAKSKFSNGYMYVVVDQEKHLLHRLAWFYIYGRWPVNQIDHKNRIRTDNRIDNLREADQSENNQNMLIGARNKSGFKGVSWCNRDMKWSAYIRVNGRTKNLGRHDTKEAAYAAYLAAASAIHTRNAAVCGLAPLHRTN